MKKNVQIPIVLFLCMLFLFSCSKNDSSGVEGEVTIKGVLRSPNGETPISDAIIFAPKDGASYRMSSMNANRNPNAGCEAPATANYGFTCTQPDGSFELNLDGISGNSVWVVFRSGAFEFKKEISLTGNVIDLGNVPLQTGAAKIAVVTGPYDRLQDILAKLGFGQVSGGELVIGTETFDLYDGDYSLPGDYPDIAKLFKDNDGDGKIDLHNYDIVFINCGASETPLNNRPGATKEELHRELHESRRGGLSASSVDELKSFVQQGGVLYCTDWASDFVEQTFPDRIDFYGSDGTPANVPEKRGAGRVGPGGIDVAGKVLDNTLASWLTGVSCGSQSCIGSNGTIHITSFLGSWVMMNGPHQGAQDVKVWIEGQVEGKTIPLTVSFTPGNGKVIYSSYHTVHEYTTEWNAQERVLQYLVFN